MTFPQETNLRRVRFRTPAGEVVPLVRVDHGATHETWIGKGGKLTLRRSAGPVVRVEIDGHGDGRFAVPILRCFAATRDRVGAVAAFLDFGALQSYDPQLRTEITTWCSDRRKSIRGLHVLATNKVVAMGVSMSRRALDGLMTAHEDRASFEAAFRRAA